MKSQIDSMTLRSGLCGDHTITSRNPSAVRSRQFLMTFSICLELPSLHFYKFIKNNYIFKALFHSISLQLLKKCRAVFLKCQYNICKTFYINADLIIEVSMFIFISISLRSSNTVTTSVEYQRNCTVSTTCNEQYHNITLNKIFCLVTLEV